MGVWNVARSVACKFGQIVFTLQGSSWQLVGSLQMDCDDEWLQSSSIASAAVSEGPRPRVKGDDKDVITEETFSRMLQTWAEKLPIGPSHSLGTWLSGRHQCGDFVVFCSVCANHADKTSQSPWATGFCPSKKTFQIGHLRRHANESKVHKAAVRAYLRKLGLQTDKAEDEDSFLNRDTFHTATKKA